MAQNGAKAWAMEAAQAYQLYNSFPWSDLIQIAGDQVDCMLAP